MEPHIKRLFFGMAAKAPWPSSFPTGRLLDEEHRHMTLAFLGNVDYAQVKARLSSFPTPSFKVGCAATFDQCLFLPEKHSHVIAWHVKLLEQDRQFENFYAALSQWLNIENTRPFLPHVTMARSPFNKEAWRESFVALPLFLQTIHLYESVGNLKYVPIWSFPLLPPFEEIEHTADIAFFIYGENYTQLFLHAALALSFKFPPILNFVQTKLELIKLEDVIIELNHLVAKTDMEMGCPFKAVSFHSHIEQNDTLLKWEMIIDV